MTHDREYPKWLYHPKKAPQGKIFETSEETRNLGRGWVDNPGKFPKRVVIDKLKAFELWCEQWKHLFGAVATLIAILAGIAGIIKLFR
jgi:hypothetical protein